MHPSVAKAFEEIDAAMFSGDEFFDPANLQALKNYLSRWNKHLPVLEEASKLVEEG